MKKHLILIILFFSVVVYSQTTPGDYTIENVKINTKDSDFGTAFFGKGKVVFAAPKDGLTINKKIWADNQQAFLDLYIGEINEKGEIVNKQKMPGEINTKYHEGVVSFTKDMKTVYFSANNYIKKKKQRTDSTGTNNIQIFKSTINENGDWGHPKLLPFNSTIFSTGHPALNVDDTELYFVSDRPESYGRTDIFVVTINRDGTYSEPRNLGPKINTEEREMFPFISDDNVLYFSSNGHMGHGELDVFASKIFDNTVSDPISLGNPVNSEKDDFAYIIDDSKHEGYFSSNREGGHGDDDIYSFLVDPPLHIECNQVIKGITKDINTQQLLPGVLVQLFDEAGKQLDSFLSKLNDASFSFEQPCNASYKIVGTLEGYLPEEIAIQTLNDLDLPPIEITMSLPPDESVLITENSDKNDVISGVVRDSDSQELLPGAVVQLLDEQGNVIETVVSNKNDASFSFEKSHDNSNTIVVTFDGYLKEEINLTTLNGTENQALLEIAMTSPKNKSAAMNEKPENNKVISGVVRDRDSQEFLTGAVVQLLDEQGNVLETVVSNKNDASFSFKTPYNNSNKIVVTSDGYVKEEINLTTLNGKENQEPLELSMGIQADESIVINEKSRININTIYFDFDKFNIRSDAQIELDRIAEVMNQYPDITIDVNSHTDSRGKNSYNIKLSNNRAESTIQYLVNKGISHSRLSGKGYGEVTLATNCANGMKCSEFQHQLNRRSEFVIVLNDLNGMTITSNNIQNSSISGDSDSVVQSGIIVNYNFDRSDTTLVYTAQVGAFRGNVQSNKYDKLTNLFNHRYKDGLNRYFSGKFKTPDEARNHAKLLKEKGFEGVFIVGLKNDGRL